MKFRIAVLLALGAIGARQASASIIITLGDVSFTDQTQQNGAAFDTADGSGGNALVDLAPFNGVACGTDTNTAGQNCSTTWTFTYSIPVGETITAATFGIGISDLDTHAAGNQVGSLIVAGADLTVDINTQAENPSLVDLSFGQCPPSPGTNNCWSSVYRQYTITIPSSAFVQLGTGSATVTFSTQGPGWGVLGNSVSNSAYLDYSTLSITTVPTGSVPEPGSLYSMAAGLAGLGLLRYRRRKA